MRIAMHPETGPQNAPLLAAFVRSRPLTLRQVCHVCRSGLSGALKWACADAGRRPDWPIHNRLAPTTDPHRIQAQPATRRRMGAPPAGRRSDTLEASAAAVRTARVAGSATAGVVELFGFHPVDTVAKRLMNHAGAVRAPGASFAASLDGYARVALRDAHGDPSILRRYLSLFPGLSFAAGYKILQRVYKFGGQPFVRELIDRHAGDRARRMAGGDRQRAKMWTHALAGAAVGVGEIVLLPLDVLKIKSQNNPAALRGRGLVQILRTERLSGLYRGAGWTAARNAPGSFALFGASAAVKGKVYGLENFNDATLGQNFVASCAGGVASITVASPLDVVKTRIQARDFGSSESGFQILGNLMRNEGPGALFKGLLPKLLVVGPKLVFSFTVAQHMIAVFEEKLAPKRKET